MFKFVVLVACLACIGFVLSKPVYTTKYDNVDLDEILNNERLFQNYYKCLLDEGKCPPDGAELKKVLPEALATNCAECSEKQKEGAKKMFKHMIDKRPDEWKVLEAKYDPTGTYRTKYANLE